jgi:CRP/FNR family cyclic AMP-dependent transcriptional regulator
LGLSVRWQRGVATIAPVPIWSRVGAAMATQLQHQERVRPFLKKNTFLGRLPDVVLDALLRKGQLKRYSRGETIYRRGDRGDSLVVLIAGRIKLTNISAGAREVVLHFAGVGEIVGEIAALDGKERPVSAVALEECEVFVIHTRDLLPTLAAHPQAMLEIIRALCEKVRAGALLLEDRTLAMRGRTAKGLLRLTQQHGRRRKDGVYLQLTLSQEELGHYLGLSRANVSRELGWLKDANVIRVGRTQIVITDEGGLAEIADAAASRD